MSDLFILDIRSKKFPLKREVQKLCFRSILILMYEMVFFFLFCQKSVDLLNCICYYHLGVYKY